MKSIVLNLEQRKKIYSNAIISSILILFAIMIFSIIAAGSAILVATKTAIGIYMSKIGMRYVVAIGVVTLIGLVVLFIPYVKLQIFARNIRHRNYESYIVPIINKYVLKNKYYIMYNRNNEVKSVKVGKNIYFKNLKSVLMIESNNKQYVYDNMI